VTLVDGRWAFCPERADGGHHWRAIAPVDRDLLESLPDDVRLICDDQGHLQRGRSIPNGNGMLTIDDGKWAYCTAALKEPHHWVPMEPADLPAIDHNEVADRLAGHG
jgi:hypothetical protein